MPLMNIITILPSDILAKGEPDDLIVQDFLGTEIDATNLKNILILVRDAVPPEEGANSAS